MTERERDATVQLSQEQIERWRDWYHTGNHSEKFAGSFDELCNMALMAALLPDSSEDGGDNFNTTAHALARAFGDLSSRDRYIASMAYSDGRIHALRSTPSPIAWMWQHPETGMKGFIEHCSAEDRTHWERMNKPREIVRPVYDHVVQTPSAIPSAEDQDAVRFRQLVADPETARHLLLLLSQAKGNEESFRKMIDRIAASKEAAHVVK